MLKAKDDRFKTKGDYNTENTINQDENALFKRSSFIQEEGGATANKNEKIIFNILDVDGDGKLSFPEFYALMRNWRIFVELSGGIYSKHPSYLYLNDFEKNKEGIAEKITLSPAEIQDFEAVDKLAKDFNMNFKQYMILFNFYSRMRNVSIKNNPTACNDGDLVSIIRS